MAGPIWDASASKFVNDMVDLVKHQIGYICHYRSNIQHLKEQLEKLKAAKESILHSVDEARRNAEEIEDIVTIWLKSADDAIEAAEKILEDHEVANKSCFIARFPNMKTRYQFSRKAIKETIPALANVLHDMSLINHISHRPDVQDLEHAKNYEALESRIEVTEEIMEALKSSDVNLIGVYGMSGVGKTTLVKQQVVARVKEEGAFRVAIANVTHKWELRKVQQDIAEWLGLKFDIESPELRAVRLRARLKQEEKVLIVLDDIWETIELEKIGIPNKDEHRGCKLLMTSRDLDPLSKMGVQKHFQLQVLSKEEAWKLFESKVGNLKSSRLHQIAGEVARRCAGLPLLIVSVATSLRNKELVDWNDALEHLQKFDDKGIDAQVYSALELSYKYLADDAKSLLVLCAQRCSTIAISDLVKYTRGLNLFQRCTTIKASRNRLLKVVNDLKKLCFFQEGPGSVNITMNDVVRGFVASIACKKHHVFIVSDERKYEEWPDKDTFEQCTAISLSGLELPKLPEVLECPKLESFLFINDDRSLRISDYFFTSTKILKLVDLTELNLSPILPSSLGFLENLQTLCLDFCVLGDISTVGELSKLKVLSLIGSNIVELPVEIRKLTHLQVLDLSDCASLKVIPRGVLSSLMRLEELCMLGCSVQWEEGGNSIGNASLSELKALCNLINLELHVMDGKTIPVDLFRENLERFKIFIGDNWNWYVEDETSRVLKLTANAGNELKSIKVLLEGADDLYLNDLKGLKNVLPQIDGHGFPELKHLQIQNSTEMAFIIDQRKMGSINAFPCLESLSLFNLNKLEMICNGPCTRNCFNSLKKLEVGKCNALENLFSLSLFRCLIQLQEINVSDCKILKEIVAMKSEGQVDNVMVNDEPMNLSQLRKLTLEDLPNFGGFFSTTNKANAELKNLFGEKVHLPNLIELKLSSIHVEKIWHKYNIQSYDQFRKLTSLIVHGCGYLTSVLTSSMVRGLVKLTNIEICNCKLMEEVISAHGETTEQILLPKVKHLKLKGLAKVAKFCISTLIQFPSLKELWLENCPRLKSFASTSTEHSNEAGQQDSTLFDEKVEFPLLEQLNLFGVSWSKVIWGNKFHGNSFCQLKSLSIKEMKDLVKIFPDNSGLRRFQNLEELDIDGCDALIEVFDIQALVDVKEIGVIPSSRLRLLRLRNLPNLKHIWSDDPEGILHFQNLHDAEIYACPSLTTVFPASVARSLLHLENLFIRDSGIQEIKAKDEEVIEGTYMFEFPALKSLDLRRLPQLKILPRSTRSDFPALKNLFITQCDKFQNPALLYEQVIPNLEKLALSGKEVRMLREGQLSMDLFHNLKEAEFNFFYDKFAVFPFDVLHIFQNLEILTVVWIKLKKLLPHEELVDDEMHQLILTKVRSLCLAALPNLEVIWEKLLETLDQLLVGHCDNLIILTPSLASFKRLKSLHIYKCGGLVSLVKSSASESLVHLERLGLRKCYKMKVVIPEEEGETMDEITFSKLESLELDCLPCLTSFSSANRPFKFSSLVYVVVKQCPKMEFFCKSTALTPWLAGVRLTDEENREDWLGDLNLTISSSYKKMAGFLGLKHLKMSEFINLKDRWHTNLPVENFCEVRTLIVDMDMLSSYAIPPKLLEYLNELEELEVSSCKTMEETFDVRGLSVEHGHTNLLPKLKRFRLLNLPSLRNIWTEYPQELLNFKCVTLLKVHDCSSLRMIFSPSIARGLVQLQEMEVKRCNSVEEIITSEETDEMISFPRLNSLILECLPRLTSFYTGTFVQCPSLEKITAVDCPQIDVFTFTFDEANPVFFGKVECSSLKELRVDWNNSVKKLWYEESIGTPFFCNLKVLKLTHFPIDCSTFPSNFVERISTNLEELLINDASFEEIFSKEVTINDEEFSRKVTPLRRLNLCKLPQLRYLIKDQTRTGLFFENLEDLEILECTTLTILVPPLISFRYLKTLKVSKCHGLLNLMTSSTARSLTQLTRFEVTECEMVEEIVASEGGEVEAEILFGCLNYLELHHLPKLVRFCSGSETFRFPNLEEVIVRECPNLETFVRGKLLTPNLEAVQIAEDGNEWCWEGSLNATIQKLFKEMAEISKGLKTEEH